MDFINEILKNLSPAPKLNEENSIVDKLNINLDQISCDKQKLENFIDLKRKQLFKLEELLKLLSNSEETLLKIKKKFKCEKCSGDLKQQDKHQLEIKKDQLNQPVKSLCQKPINKVESNTFNRLQKILNDCTKTKPENGTKKYQYTIENKGLKINRSKPHPELEPFDLTNFKLVQLHRHESLVHEDFNSIEEWTVIKRVNRNTALESKMAKRNGMKLDKLKQNSNSDTLSLLSKRNLISDMHMLMNYDFCNNRYGYKDKKPKKIKKKTENSKLVSYSDKNDDLMMELYGFETENKENVTAPVSDDLYEDLNDNLVADLIQFDLKNGQEQSANYTSVNNCKEPKKILSPKKEPKKSEMTQCVKQDVYSRRNGRDGKSSKTISRRSRSSSRSRKRSRSRSISRSSSKRRELSKTHDDKRHQKHDNIYKYNYR